MDLTNSYHVIVIHQFLPNVEESFISFMATSMSMIHGIAVVGALMIVYMKVQNDDVYRTVQYVCNCSAGV